MTTGAIKRQGTVIILTGGRHIMDFAEAIDNGTAPEIFVNGPSRIEKIGAGTIRAIWYSRQEDGNIVVLKVIMDLAEWLAVWTMVAQARATIVSMPVPDSPSRPRAAD